MLFKLMNIILHFTELSQSDFGSKYYDDINKLTK
jgi:hypothetical protein